MSTISEGLTGEGQYQIVRTIMECSLDNMIGCMEQVILFSVAFVSSVYGIIALRLILKDRNSILDLWDKVIVAISVCELLMLVGFFGYLDSQLWHYSIRTLRFINSVLVCFTVFCIHELSEEARRNVIKFFKGAVAYALGLWFFCGFLNSSTPEAPYDCLRFDWILISASTLFVSCVQVYVTLSIIQQIQNYTNPDTGMYTEEGIQNYSKDDGDNRKVQLTGLMLGSILPAVLQFSWDYFSNAHATTSLECNQFFFADSIFTLLAGICIKLATYFLMPWAILFVFYWKNKEYINTVQDNPNDQIFFDRRSELLEKHSF